jgi:hypothetical protein
MERYLTGESLMLSRGRQIDRKTFLRNAGGMLALIAVDPTRSLRPSMPIPSLTHPEPRPGITAERVLTAEALGSSRREKVLSAYEAARTYPEIFDGLACTCGCTGSGPLAHRSLLVCYETMQPTGCIACQDEANLVAKMRRELKLLSEIREAVDKSNR